MNYKQQLTIALLTGNVHLEFEDPITLDQMCRILGCPPPETDLGKHEVRTRYLAKFVDDIAEDLVKKSSV